jgi:methionyl-tRNA formyltransferase
LNTPSELRLGVAGTPEFSVPALERLAAVRRVVAVFTQPDRPAGRGQALRLSPIKRRALELGLPVYQPDTLKTAESRDLVASLELDLLVVVAYGLILPQAVLDTPRLGCINIHASLLPRWRGAAPIQRALLAGDASTGVTIMRMEAGLDTGPMLARRSTPISALDTGESLHDRLAEIGADLMVATLQAIEGGSPKEEVQPDQGITYAQKLSKAEARIDWDADAAGIWRKVRAFNPWPVAETRLDGQQVRIWEAQLLDPAGQPGAAPGTVLSAGSAGIDILCGSGCLRVTRLQLAGRKPLQAADFLAGQRLDGARFE